MKGLLEIGAQAAGELASAGLRAFFRTSLGMLCLGFVFAVACYILAADGSVWRGLLAAFIAAVCFTVIGLIVAGRRAVAAVIRHGVHRFALAQDALTYLFRFLGLEARPDAAVASGAADTLTLADAAAKLRRFADSSGLVAQADGGLATAILGKVRNRLARLVGGTALLELESCRTPEGNVDLARLRDTLAQRIDRLVIDRIERQTKRLTLMLVLVAGALSCLLAWGLRQF
jgi:hypothetical protein